jgi:hypothetical protein
VELGPSLWSQYYQYCPGSVLYSLLLNSLEMNRRPVHFSAVASTQFSVTVTVISLHATLSVGRDESVYPPIEEARVYWFGYDPVVGDGSTKPAGGIATRSMQRKTTRLDQARYW